MAKQDISVTLQKLANSSAKEIQLLVNKANKEGLSFNAAEAQKARAFNSAEAQKARDWQEQMTKTSHQMEVKDLKKAGLNPVLSANSGGAQSYTTSSASAQNASGSVDSGAGAASGIMSGLMSTLAGIEQTKLSAQSQQRAAQISGQYNLASAQTSAAATKYAADMNYRTQMDKPQTNLVALADKYLGSLFSNGISGLNIKTSGTSMGKSDVFTDKSGFMSLSSKADRALNKELKNLGIYTGNKSVDSDRRFWLAQAMYSPNPKIKAQYQAKIDNLVKNASAAKKNTSKSPFAGNDWNPYDSAKGYN